VENEEIKRRKGMNRIHLIISGDVIGVGFRSWVRRLAQDNHVNGWVKNREDDAVEIVAEGNEVELKKFAGECHHGPDVAWVKGVDEKWQKGTSEFAAFEVIY
jgi:acylphosphatase